MSHELEQIDGQALYAGSREVAWHRLGTTVDADLSIEEALDLAWMSGWNVRTAPLEVIAEGGRYTVDGHQIILRDNPQTGQVQPIGPIGGQYVPVQTEELADFAKAITLESDLIGDAVGSLKDGRRVFLTLRYPEETLLGGGDAVQPYLLVTSGHDGGAAVTVQATSVRVVCANTLSWALSTTEPRLSVRHTGTTIDAKVEQAREILGLTDAANKAMADLADRLMSTKFTAKQFENLALTLFPNKGDRGNPDLPLSKSGLTRREKARDDLWALRSAPTNAMYLDTAWGAVQTVTEYADWFGVGADDEVKRAERQMRGAQERWKAYAAKKVLSRI